MPEIFSPPPRFLPLSLLLSHPGLTPEYLTIYDLEDKDYVLLEGSCCLGPGSP